MRAADISALTERRTIDPAMKITADDRAQILKPLLNQVAVFEAHLLPDWRALWRPTPRWKNTITLTSTSPQATNVIRISTS